MSYIEPSARRNAFRQRADSGREAEHVRGKQEHDRKSAAAEAINGHLRLLEDKKTTPDVIVEKARRISWLRALRLADEQLIKSLWEGRFEVLSVVNGWRIPQSIKGPRRGHYVQDNATIGMQGGPDFDWVEDPQEQFDAVVTSDGLITSSGNVIHDHHADESIVSVRAYDLAPIESEIHQRTLTRYGGLLTIDWPRIDSHLEALATSDVKPID